MEIKYKNKSVEKDFNPAYAKSWNYPEEVKRGMVKAHDFIENAESLHDVFQHTPFHFERMKGKLKNRKKPTGEWSIAIGGVVTGYRAILIPCDDNGQKIIGKDVLAIAKSILIIEVTEVTNHYE